MVASSWLVGSYPSMPAETISVTANATAEDLTLASASRYLDDPTASLSLCEALALMLESHSQITTADCYVQQDGLVYLEANVAFTLTWPANSIAEEMTGFGADLSSSATSHTASAQSKWLWIPARTEISDARLGKTGWPVHDTQVGMSATGNMISTRHNTVYTNTLTWDACIGHTEGGARNVVSSTSDNPYEWEQWWLTVASRFRQFKHYRALTYDADSTTDSGLDAATPLGPYKPNTGGGAFSLDSTMSRKILNVEKYWTVTIPIVTVTEYS